MAEARTPDQQLTEAELARHYHWLNLHPAKEAETLRAWLRTSQAKFQAQQQVYPLVLEGEPNSGRRYLLNAAFFQRTQSGLPVMIVHWDMEVWDAASREQQIAHMQARLEDFAHHVRLNNPSLYTKFRETLHRLDSITLPIGVDLSLNLEGFWDLILPPLRSQQPSSAAEDSFTPMKALLLELLSTGHVILHIRQAELLDQGLLERLRTVIKYLNLNKGKNQGFMALALSFVANYPVGELLGAVETYASHYLPPFSKQRVAQALRDMYGAEVAKHESVQCLLQHAALASGKLDASAVGQLINSLLEQGLLNYDPAQQHWYLAAQTELKVWQAAIGESLEMHWHTCMEQLDPSLRRTLKQFFSLAALGGEWIPVDLLLKYLQITDTSRRDALIDVLDETLASFLHCVDWKFIGIEGLVYCFKSPLLPSLLLDTAHCQTQANEIIDWLQKHWGNTKQRNQASYLLSLARYAPAERAHQLREALAWQVEAEFSADLEVHIFERLLSGELSLKTLDGLMDKHQALWPMPHRRAICRAWLAYYQQHQELIPLDQTQYSGQDWEELWQSTADSIVPANEEGLALCYFYGQVQTDAGEWKQAQAWFELGLKLVEKYPNLGLEGHFHLGLAQSEYQQGDLLRAEQRLRDKALPCYEQLGDVRPKAETMMWVAVILQVRGQLDEALHIYQTEGLPVYEQLGDVRSKAVTMVNIAHILLARGQLDAAFDILNELLPVYEQLGAVREKAVTMMWVAVILQHRGQLDAAFDILNELLPVYEQLGVVLEKAAAIRMIVDILASCNRLGALWEVICGRKSPPTQDAIQRSLKTLSEILITFQALQDARQIGRTYSQQADLYQVLGQFNSALELREQELAVFTKSGYAYELVISRTKLAMLLWQMDAKGNQAKMIKLLRLALAEAKRMKIPEAQEIEAIAAHMGLVYEIQ